MHATPEDSDGKRIAIDVSVGYHMPIVMAYIIQRSAETWPVGVNNHGRRQPCLRTSGSSMSALNFRSEKSDRTAQFALG